MLLFRMALSDGVLQRNPAEILHTTRRKVREQPVLTLVQAILVLSVLDVRERPIVKHAGVYARSARERSSSCSGTTSTTDHSSSSGASTEKRSTLQKTRNSNRKVALPNSVGEDIDARRTLSTNPLPNAWVFPSENGRTTTVGEQRPCRPRPDALQAGLGWLNYQVLRRSSVTLLNATAPIIGNGHLIGGTGRDDEAEVIDSDNQRHGFGPQGRRDESTGLGHSDSQRSEGSQAPVPGARNQVPIAFVPLPPGRKMWIRARFELRYSRGGLVRGLDLWGTERNQPLRCF
jgi:hypothetical protein